MNDKMNVLVIMAAIAIMGERGVGAAVGYMTNMGLSTNEAFGVIEQYERLREEAKFGRIIGMLPE